MTTREDELESLRATFFEEAAERIAEVEQLLLDLEQRPDDDELIAPIFRAIHSLKSGGGACELSELANFAHIFENLLDQLRKGTMRPRPSTLNVLLASTDALSSLVQKARGYEPPLGEQDIKRVSEYIQAELESAGISSIPAPAKLVSSDGLEGLVLWDDEPAVTAASTTVPPQLTFPPVEGSYLTSMPVAGSPVPVAMPSDTPLSEADAFAGNEAAATASAGTAAPASDGRPPTREEGEEEEDVHEGAPISSERLSRLVDLSVELVVASAALSHAVSDPDTLSIDRVRALFTEVQAHAGELESQLAQVRSDQSSALAEVVFVCVGEDYYFLPLGAVEHYFSPAPHQLRNLPVLGEILEYQSRVLPVTRLRNLIGRPLEPDPAQVAVVMHTRVGRVALLVDEVRTQTRVVVRPLYSGFGEASGLLGAALYAGKVVLVLDPERVTPARRHASAIAS